MADLIYRYDRLELPADGCDTAKVLLPDGKAETLSAFLKQDIRTEYDNSGTETVITDGEPYKLFRFFPAQCGTYRIKTAAFEKEFTVKEGENHGYIKVSNKDPRYLSYTDGTPCFLIGINLAYPSPGRVSSGKEFGYVKKNVYMGIRQYERWFKSLAENGVNMARIWLGHDYFCLDTETAGELNISQFSKLDLLLDLAKKYDIKLKLTLEQFRFFDYEKTADTDAFADVVFRTFNKKLYAHGKRCENIHEWLTSDTWKNLWLYKVSELAKRISGNTSVFAIELWNEMNCLDDPAVVEWNREMLPKVKALFPRHLVTNSLGSYDGEWSKNAYENFCWEETDIKQMHRYLDGGAPFAVCHSSPINLICDGMNALADNKKPFLVAETGAVNNCHSGPFKYYSCDHDGMLFCDLVYTPVFRGSCGVGNIWHWGEPYVEAKNLYKYFKPIAELCENLDFADEDFEPDICEDENAVLLILRGKTHTLCYLKNKSYNWENVLRDLKEAAPVGKFALPFDAKAEIRVINIRDGETATVGNENGKAVINNIKYGLLMKIQ